ncbi:MAG TPA: c-type cytochrome [Nocardioidaceae bacterium]|jgi:cytochrome c1
MTPSRNTRGWVLVLLGASLLLAACAEPEQGEAPPQEATVGSPDRGAELIRSYGCGSCHMVPGVDGADGLVGPPLTHFARRSYIAGELPNSEDNLHRWIRDPQAVEPGTAMPDLGVTERDAEDITAYLYTLK